MSTTALPGSVDLGGGGSYGSSGSLSSNPTVAPIDLTVQGSDFLWAVFAVMLATALGVTAWMYSLPAGRRAFHAPVIMLLFTASIAYFSMASNLGATPIPVEFVRNRSDLYTGTNYVYPNRSIWYVRYIDWVVTTPLLLLTLLLGTAMPTSNIVFIIFMDLVMIVTGLIGALVHSSYKWGYFTFGCVAMLFVFWGLVGPGRAGANALGPAYGKAYIKSAVILATLWFLYPIAWGLADGGNVISTDGEMIFYGVLDLLAKPVYSIIHLSSLRSLDYSNFGFRSGHSSSGYEPALNGNGPNGNGIVEKGHHTFGSKHNGTNGAVGNGANGTIGNGTNGHVGAPASGNGVVQHGHEHAHLHAPVTEHTTAPVSGTGAHTGTAQVV